MSAAAISRAVADVVESARIGRRLTLGRELPRKVSAAGGPFSGVRFYREKTYGGPAGVAGCPESAGTSGCIGEYYILRTRDA